MGNACDSCKSTSIVTAKLILHDGRLQEFPNPIRVSQILEKNPNCFVCSSDDMDLDTLPCAIDEEDHLQIGELYFALPLSWLNNPLCMEDMVALAIKASRALKKNGANFQNNFLGCGIKKVDLLLPLNRVVEPSHVVMANSGSSVTGGAGGGGGFPVRRKRRGPIGKRSGCSFKEKLTVILEEQDD